MSTPQSPSTSTSATVTVRCGTKSPSHVVLTEASARIVKKNVATKVPRVTCVPRRMKVRNIRGPNCVDASVSATIVIENTNADDGYHRCGNSSKNLPGRVRAAADHEARGGAVDPS